MHIIRFFGRRRKLGKEQPDANWRSADRLFKNFQLTPLPAWHYFLDAGSGEADSEPAIDTTATGVGRWIEHRFSPS